MFPRHCRPDIPRPSTARATPARWAFALSLVTGIACAQPSPGQRVEALDPGGQYRAATVLSVDANGARVKFTAGLWEGDERKVSLKAIRGAKAGNDAVVQADKRPRPAGGYAVKAGVYDCVRAVPVFLGSTTVNGVSMPQYRFDRHSAGTLTLRTNGTADIAGATAAFAFDAATGQVVWRDGPYKGIESTHRGDKLTMLVAKPAAIECSLARR